MVPRLPLDRLELRNLAILVGRGCHEYEVALLRHDEQKILLGEQEHLAGPVTAALPDALSGLEVDGREDSAIEAVGVSFVDHVVIEVRLQPTRRPALLDLPRAGAVGGARHREAADAQAVHHFARCRQHIAVLEHLWLDDPHPGFGVVRPEDAAVEADAGDAAAIHQ